MIIKKFVGKTEEEAVAAAKKELGEGVVVMNVKTVDRKGFWGIFAPKQTEVTVAREEGTDNYRAVRERPVSGAAGAVKLEAVSAPSSGSMLRSGSVDMEDRISIEKKLDSLQTLLVNRLKESEAEREESSGAGENMPAEEEYEEERQEETEQQRFVRLLYNTMLENEVDEKYANQIVGDIDGTQTNVPFDHILANIYQKIVLKFGKADGIMPAEDGAKLVLFMGPTGVGKTTTIAKIASCYAVEEKRKVALLTADTYRIAAVEQLHTYANILEVPFRVVYTEEEMKEAIREFQDYDYIFIDTAGHSHRNSEQLAHTKELVAAVEETGEWQAFLVLSATTKYRDLLKIVQSYDSITDFQLIFTKLDETAAMGNLLNMKLYTDTPIAFVTNGQNVPSDIEQFNPQKTVKQILTTKSGDNF